MIAGINQIGTSSAAWWRSDSGVRCVQSKANTRSPATLGELGYVEEPESRARAFGPE
ncbi:hypothetical protein IGI04_032823 [Brassica rapa subsp. trilocularis]|uniref:Uncharacterized protein n=1 Tax=Brassica rapa subsp. trilocularis TaxID=1813537 RepID=A0ABQ7LXH6_BRACM|nr:hypothetical protein IGI04_032823 [Brassica rapa subsp. trilocularis]